MRKEVKLAIDLLLGLPFAAVVLDPDKRKRIKVRDGERCQATAKNIRCGGKLEVDHIIPKEFAEGVLGMPPHNHGNLGYNDPPNLLTKCENHHRGHPDSHHPDVHKALYDYREGDREAIGRAVREHKKKSDEGRIYWNNRHDKEDRLRAIDLSEAEDKKRGGRKSWWPF
jgi:hypothetical protein